MGPDCKAGVIQGFGSMGALRHRSFEHSGGCIGYTAMTPWSTLASVSLYGMRTRMQKALARARGCT